MTGGQTRVARTVRFFIVAAAWAIAVAPLTADLTGTHAIVAISPAHPRVDEPCHVRVSLRAKNGYAIVPQRATIVGEMTGHPMRPVEAELVPAVAQGVSPAPSDLTTTLAFTMSGPWRLTLRVEEGAAVLVGTTAIDVVGEGADTGGPEIRLLVDLLQPARANLIPPSWVAIGAIALTAAMQAAASILARRRRAHPRL